MNYLSGATPQANVPVMWAISRWIASHGEASFSELSEALRPETVVTGEENAFRASLIVGRHIGVFAAPDDEGPWTLGVRLTAGVTASHHEFRTAIRDALLAQAVEDLSGDRQPADVAVGLAWLCTLDPRQPLHWKWSDGTEDLVRRVGLSDIIVNETQWRIFRRWAIGLGLAVANNPRRAAQVLVPDVSVALSDVLLRLPERLRAPEFLNALSKQLPCVDTGALEAVLVSRGIEMSSRGEARIGPCLGHALRRLEERGELSLISIPDASHRLSYRHGDRTNTFDEVVVAGVGR